MATTNDFMGGCSFKISDILENPKSGWFKLSDMGEAELEEAEEVDEAVEAEGEGGGDGGGDAGGWGLEDLDHRAVSVGHEVVVSDVGVSPKD